MARQRFKERNGSYVGIFPEDHEVGFVAGKSGIRRVLIRVDELAKYPKEDQVRMLDQLYHAKQYELLNERAKAEEVKLKKKRQKNKTTLKQASAIWLKEIEATNSKRTYSSYKQTITIYFKYCSDVLAADFGRAENTAFLKALKTLPNAKNENTVISASTQNMHMRQFQVFINWCYDSEYIPKIVRLKKPRKPVKEMETLDSNELELLATHLHKKSLEKLDKRNARKYKNLYRAFMMARHTLVRSGTLWAMKLDWIDLERRTISIQANPELEWSPKAMKWPVKPMNDTLYKFLVEDLKERSPSERYFLDNSLGKPWYYEANKLGAALAKEIKAIGLPEHIKPFHWGIRGTLITKLLNDGANPTDVQKLADHSSLATTMLYFNSRKASQEKAVSLLESDS